MAERCPVCGDVLHPTQDGFYAAVNGCSVCHGKLWTPAELALARATAAKREAELLAELESWRSVASKASAEVITADARVAEQDRLIVKWAKDLEIWKHGGEVDCDSEIHDVAARIAKLESEQARSFHV